MQSHKHTDSGHRHDFLGHSNFFNAGGGGGPYYLLLLQKSAEVAAINLEDPTDSGTGTPRHGMETRSKVRVCRAFLVFTGL